MSIAGSLYDLTARGAEQFASHHRAAAMALACLGVLAHVAYPYGAVHKPVQRETGFAG